MSVEQNKATLRSFVEDVWNKGNTALAKNMVSPYLVIHMMPPGTPPGVEALNRLIAMVRTAFPDIHYTVEDLVTEGDKVVMRLTATGTHLGPYFNDSKGALPPTGKRFSMQGIDIWRFDQDGRLAECWSTYDRLAQLQQLGVIQVAATTPG